MTVCWLQIWAYWLWDQPGVAKTYIWNPNEGTSSSKTKLLTCLATPPPMRYISILTAYNLHLSKGQWLRRSSIFDLSSIAIKYQIWFYWRTLLVSDIWAAGQSTQDDIVLETILQNLKNLVFLKPLPKADMFIGKMEKSQDSLLFFKKVISLCLGWLIMNCN